jgi:hypothetical protein
MATPGAVIPVGNMITPGGKQGPQGPPGTAIPLADNTQNGLLKQVSGKSTDYVGGDNLCHSISVITPSFVLQSSAYALTASDSGKYFICSGGNWTLTLPVATAGLSFRLRNDMGITGTVGTITLQPTGGLIDGQASLSLLPQQECTLITDGTNWRTFELKREVILGYLTVTNVASFNFQLPNGYSEFEISCSELMSSATGMPNLQAQLSSNGGSSWLTTGAYWGTYGYDSAAATWATAAYSSLTAWYMTHYLENGAFRHFANWKLLPGNGTQCPQFIGQSAMYQQTVGYAAQFLITGWYNSAVKINAIQFALSANNITRATIKVKGIV